MVGVVLYSFWLSTYTVVCCCRRCLLIWLLFLLLLLLLLFVCLLFMLLSFEKLLFLAQQPEELAFSLLRELVAGICRSSIPLLYFFRLRRPIKRAIFNIWSFADEQPPLPALLPTSVSQWRRSGFDRDATARPRPFLITSHRGIARLLRAVRPDTRFPPTLPSPPKLLPLELELLGRAYLLHARLQPSSLTRSGAHSEACRNRSFILR